MSVCVQFEVSPLQLAIETLRETNQKIRSLIDQHLADATLKVDPLGMVLNGVVDAAVSGGIANYKASYITTSPGAVCMTLS